MQEDIAQFIPFIHEHFEFKQNLIKIAREQNRETIEGTLAATLLYVNTVDYLASHILENLRKIVYLTTYTEHNATVFYSGKNEREDETLGYTIEKLKNYAFPDKVDFIDDLGKFNKLRNKYIHNFLKMDASNDKELEKGNKELIEIIKISERIITKYDRISQGIRDSWFIYTGRVNERLGLTVPPATQQDEGMAVGEDEKSKKNNESKKAKSSRKNKT